MFLILYLYLISYTQYLYLYLILIFTSYKIVSYTYILYLIFKSYKIAFQFFVAKGESRASEKWTNSGGVYTLTVIKTAHELSCKTAQILVNDSIIVTASSRGTSPLPGACVPSGQS
jgi:hypothetical protein